MFSVYQRVSAEDKCFKPSHILVHMLERANFGIPWPRSSEYTGEEKNHAVYLECTYANILVDMFDGAGQVVCARNGGGEGGGDEPSPPAPGTNMFVTSRAPLLRL